MTRLISSGTTIGWTRRSQSQANSLQQMRNSRGCWRKCELAMTWHRRKKTAMLNKLHADRLWRNGWKRTGPTSTTQQWSENLTSVKCFVPRLMQIKCRLTRSYSSTSRDEKLQMRGRIAALNKRFKSLWRLSVNSSMFSLSSSSLAISLNKRILLN